MREAGRNPKYRQAADAIAARIRNGGYLPGAVLPGEVMLVYLGVAEELARRIAEGVYRAGSRLPSEQRWAREFGISQGTVRRAVKELRGRGLIHTVAGRGSFVGPEGTPIAPDYLHPHEELAEHLAGRIKAGEFADGKPLPAEEDLAAEYGVARGTLRVGLKILRGRKLVETVAARGTYPVADPDTDAAPVDADTGGTWADLVRGRGSRVTLPVQVADILARRIQEGQLAPGDRMPTEQELITEFRASWGPARWAYPELQARGLIHNVPNVGWFVGPPDTRSDHTLPLFERIAGKIAERIRAREWEPGAALFPGILKREYGVGQTTMSQAMHELRGRGWAELTRSGPGGTVVSSETRWPVEGEGAGEPPAAGTSEM